MDVSLLRVYNNGYTMRRSCIMFCRQSCDEKRVIVDVNFSLRLFLRPTLTSSLYPPSLRLPPSLCLYIIVSYILLLQRYPLSSGNSR
jgi:hypothetical protein